MSAIFSQKELSKYSLTRALNQLIESQRGQPPGCNGRLKDFEGEVHDALFDHYKSHPRFSTRLTRFESMEPIDAFNTTTNCLARRAIAQAGYFATSVGETSAPRGHKMRFRRRFRDLLFRR